MTIIIAHFLKIWIKYWLMIHITFSIPTDTYSSIHHRFDIKIPHQESVDISSIMKRESTCKE